ncbi:hypothetical protein FB451DRAFT_1533829 [Mycena latifolia]|nr:hypothetical protein FB451DRAFT_1533829 [Mycena latifolia]
MAARKCIRREPVFCSDENGIYVTVKPSSTSHPRGHAHPAPPPTSKMAFQVLKKMTAIVVLALSALTLVSSTPANPQSVTTFTRDPRNLSFMPAYWLWTSKPNSRPLGIRTFRKTFTTPVGKAPVLADILITADDKFTLYMNGELIGPTRAYKANRFCVALRPCINVFAATADSTFTDPGGIQAKFQISYADNSTSTVISDASWLVALTAPAGFERLEFDDSAWTPAYLFKQWSIVDNDPPGKVECKNVESNPCPCTNG